MLKSMGRVFLSFLILVLVLNSVAAFLSGNEINGLLLVCLAYVLDNKLTLGQILDKLGDKNEGCGCKANKSTHCNLSSNAEV